MAERDLSASDLERRLGVPIGTLSRWCRAGLVPSARKVGLCWLFSGQAIVEAEKLVQAHRLLAGRSRFKRDE